MRQDNVKIMLIILVFITFPSGRLDSARLSVFRFVTYESFLL